MGLMLQNFAPYLLVIHGSSDPRPLIAVEQLAKVLSVRLQEWAAPALVGTAVLELGSMPLNKQILQFSESVVAAGYGRLQVLPLFLLPGVHVAEDIPAEVAIAQQVLGQQITIELLPYLGSTSRIKTVLGQAMAPYSDFAKVIVSHGSRRLGANQTVAAIARHLQASVAFWSTEPRLDHELQCLIQRGAHRIAIFPYFLFEGGITDAIAVQVAQWAERFPELQWYLAPAIGASPALVDFIL
jgi:sirohydrochlorin ferrochelatase